MALANEILIIATDPQELNWLAEMAERYGYAGLQATNVAAAIKILERETPHAIISDVDMPGNHNLELIERLPSQARSIPIILVARQPDPALLMRSLDLPVVACLVKPVEPERLVQSLKQAVMQSRMYLAMREWVRRMDHWVDEVGRMHAAISRIPRAVPRVAMGDFVQMAIGNTLSSVMDLHRLVAAYTEAARERNACGLFACPRLETYRLALQDAVNTLEKTRGYIKSRELGELRQRLERCLDVHESDNKSSSAVTHNYPKE